MGFSFIFVVLELTTLWLKKKKRIGWSWFDSSTARLELTGIHGMVRLEQPWEKSPYSPGSQAALSLSRHWWFVQSLPALSLIPTTWGTSKGWNFVNINSEGLPVAYTSPHGPQPDKGTCQNCPATNMTALVTVFKNKTLGNLHSDQWLCSPVPSAEKKNR